MQHLDTLACHPLPSRSGNQALRVSSLQQVCAETISGGMFSVPLPSVDDVATCRFLSMLDPVDR